ncbi:MAG TPA: septum formation family protein [Streptomyces sp.]|nr:septum formation family protein [Streptomyces sp.]
MLTDVVAVVSLVLAFVVPPIGVILAVVTLIQIRRRRDRSWGLVPCCAALALSLYFSSGLVRDWVAGDPAVKSLYALDKGTCFNQGFSAGIQVKTVPCDGPHEGEVFTRFSFGSAGDAFPGEEQIKTVGHEKCDRRQASYARDLWAFPANVTQMLYYPHANGWSVGERKGVCAFESTPDHELPDHSLRADGSTLGAPQLTYLAAENLTNEAYLTFPAKEEVFWDLEGYQQWAQGIADAMQAEEQQLRKHSWAPDVQPSIRAFADDLADARTRWLKAAKAPDAYAFTELWEQGKKVFGGPSAVAARKALGLAHGDAWRAGGVFSRTPADK